MFCSLSGWDQDFSWSPLITRHPTPVPSGFLLAVNLILTPDLTSKAQASASSPCLLQCSSISGWVCWLVAPTDCAGLSLVCSSQTSCCSLLQGSKAPHLSRRLSASEGPSWCVETFPLSLLHLDCFLSLLFSFFLLAYPVTGTLPCPFGGLRSDSIQ